jgi:hypothetical protein
VARLSPESAGIADIARNRRNRERQNPYHRTRRKASEVYANRDQSAEVYANLGWIGMTPSEVYANLG